MRKAVVRSVGISVAEKILSNDDLERLVETSDEWIVSRTGIKERRISEPHETTAHFATRAAQHALERAGADPMELDMVVIATVTGEKQFPSVSCIVQDAIGAKKAGAMDVGAACAGFIYSLQVAGSMIETGAINNALVLGVDCLTKYVDWTDRSTCVLFGDGGGGVFLEAGDGERGLIETVMRSDGGGARHIELQLGKSLMPDGGLKAPYIFMAGQEVYRFAVKAMGDSCCSVLEKAGMSVEDVDLFVPHQANLRIIDAARNRLGLPPEKVYVNVEKYGNMSAGSIPVALYEAEQEGKLKKGDVVLTVGFGAGLVWGANLIRW